MKTKILILLVTLTFVPILLIAQTSKIDIHKGYLKYNREKAIEYASNWWHSINIAGGYTSYYKEGGDCANFVSQILISGGFRDLVTGVPTNLTNNGPTIKGAKQLSSRLIGYPLAEPKKLNGAKSTILTKLNFGDII